MRITFALAAAALGLGGTALAIAASPSSDTVAPIVGIYMMDAQNGWAITARCDPCPPNVTSNLLLRTADGGTRWKDVTPVDSSGTRTRFYGFYPLNSQIVLVDKVRTVDGGQTWKLTSSPGWGTISFLNRREGWLILPLAAYLGHTDVDILHTSDGGETWDKISSNTEGSGLTNLSGMGGINFFTFTTGWITGGGGPINWHYLFVTRDGGRTWQERKLPQLPQLTPNWNANLGPLTILSSRDGVVRADYGLWYFPGRYESPKNLAPITVFFVTHDAGVTWTYTTPVPVPEGKDAPRIGPSTVLNMNRWWVRVEDTLYATNDGGRRWTRRHSGELMANVSELAFISQDVGWAVRNTDPYGGGARQSPPFLLKTVDGGRTWTAIRYVIDGP